MGDESKSGAEWDRALRGVQEAVKRLLQAHGEDSEELWVRTVSVDAATGAVSIAYGMPAKPKRWYDKPKT